MEQFTGHDGSSAAEATGNNAAQAAYLCSVCSEGVPPASSSIVPVQGTESGSETLPELAAEDGCATLNRYQAAAAIRTALPPGGLFAGQTWRISPKPFALGSDLARELDTLGRVLLQFYRAANLLHRQSFEGRQPEWIARLLDQGKPESLLSLQRHPALKNEVPRVIRPDILLVENGFAITELDSVPGGIGLTAWLNKTYSALPGAGDGPGVIGGSDEMLRGFAGIFGAAPQVHLMVSEEAASYRPEMEWLAERLGKDRFNVVDTAFQNFKDGDEVYRFFEMFDVGNVSASAALFAAAAEKRIRLTPPPKPALEEKLLFALLWNRNLRDFWRQNMGDAFFKRMLQHVPYTWAVDPAPLPPHAAIPRLELTDWNQLKTLSQRERDLILKISGFSPEAWGARSVHLGSDLSQADWAAAVDRALRDFPKSPWLLQQYHKPRRVDAEWFDFERGQAVSFSGRVRLCPYYFVEGEGDAARPRLCGVLATICPADKKIIHGMTDAVLAPCCA